MRQQALALHVEGLSFRRIARLLSVNPQSVANWVAAQQRALHEQGQQTLPVEDGTLGQCQTVELDELQVFIGARRGKKTLGLHSHGSGSAHALHRGLVHTCVNVAGGRGAHLRHPTAPVVDQIEQARPAICRQFYSDGLNTYPTLLYYNGKHEANEDKSQTYSVEAVNADMRHYLARLDRRSRCFWRKVESLRQAFWLFVYCYNRRRLLLHRNVKLKDANLSLAQFLPAIL